MSVDSKHTHLAWTRTDRKDGGIGNIQYPLLSDLTKEMSKNFGVLVVPLNPKPSSSNIKPQTRRYPRTLAYW